MGERNITLFALHLHNNGNIQFGPERISTGGEEKRRVRDRLRGSRRSLPIPLSVAGVALFTTAVVAWRFLTAAGRGD